MIRYLPRAVSAAVLGGLAGAAGLVVLYAARPDFTATMDRDLPRAVTGVYPVERDASGDFAWSGKRAEIVLPGLDRRAPWTFRVRMRGGRGDPTTLPDVTLAVDGVIAAARRAVNEPFAMAAPVPTRPGKAGLTITLDVSSTMTPGPADPRQLGIVIDEMSLAPDRGAVVLPPPRQLGTAAFAAAVFGACFGLIGATAGSAVAAAIVLAGLQAAPLASGFGPFSPYTTTAAWLACSLALALASGAWLVQRIRAVPLRNTARFAAAFSVVSLYLQLLVLLHPDKHIGDALFHAHRLEWVLSGRWFFTSVTPGYVQFPYAIALYVLAAPFTALAHDLVALLRVVTTTANAAAGLLLYPLVVRAWGDRLAAAGAVVLFHLVPLPFNVLATANLTNSFGESAAVAAMFALTSPRLDARHVGCVAVSALLVAAAFLSHTSTFAILLVTVALTGSLYWLRGGRLLRPAASGVLLALAIATLASVALFYGHFGAVYRTEFARVRAEMNVPGPSAARPAAGGESAARPPRDVPSTKAPSQRLPGQRLRDIPGRLGLYLGWPALALGALGAWRLAAVRRRDRLTLALGAWGLSCLGFLALGVATPLDLRHYLAFCPVLAVAAGSGAAWAWRQGHAARILLVILLAWAAGGAVRPWIGWIR